VNWFDYLLVVILVVSVVQGLWQGFTRLALSLAATIVGLLAGLWFYGVIGAFYAGFLKSEPLADFLGFVTIFVAVRLAGALLGWGLSKIFKAAGLSWLDRLLGGAFGALRTALVATGLVLILAAFPFKPLSESIARSQAAPYLLEGAQFFAALAPKELKDGFQKSYEDMQKLWNQTVRPKGQANV
jgi:membrane protein required for colicin V production